MIVAERPRQVIGPYAIQSQIGRGGMGVVYRAMDTRSGRLVALKSVRLRSPELVSCFRREVHALASLSHPGIVRIVDHGITDGIPWYAMELISGPTLARLLSMGREDGPLEGSTVECISGGASALSGGPATRARPRSPLEFATACRLVRGVCRALAFFHAQGLVHRDLKPENILIRSDDEPVLVDFGLVAQCGGSAGREVLDHASARVGTVAYMAPEQRFGRLVDARADLFSLGCILYECLTGELPFGPSGALLANFRPSPPSALNPKVPCELDSTVLGLLARDPCERIGYADDVEMALARMESAGAPAQVSGSTYIYRPEIVGRDASLSRLDTVLSKARCGEGGFVLLTGESGVGKTRLLIELGAQASERGMQVVTGGCPPVGAAASEGRTLGRELGLFRGVLQTTADICRSRDPVLNRRLLSERARVLAPYEPQLLNLPGLPLEDEPEILPSEAAKARVFSNLWGLLCDLSCERPWLIVLDDLQWADALSLEFLGWIAQGRFRTVSLVIVGASRVEEMNDDLLELTRMEGILTESLLRVDSQSVEKMVAGMLAMPAPPEMLVDYLLTESRGNPFFVAEYIRAAIAGGLLRRGPGGRWTVEHLAVGELRDRVSPPPTIGELVARRLRDLDVLSLKTLRAAAVLGRAFDIDLVARTAELATSSVLDAYSTLVRRQILEDDSDGTSHFVHDKLRETAYAGIAPSDLVGIHRRAAESIDARYPGVGREQHLGTIGYHLAKAGARHRAAEYFAESADHACATHANRDARRLYDLAIEQLELGDSKAPDSEDLWCRIRESLGDLDLLDGVPESARSSYRAALDRTSAQSAVVRARRHRKIALSWEQQHRHLEALSEHEVALAELGSLPAAEQPVREWWTQRVQIEVDRAWDLYWIDDSQGLLRLVGEIRSMVDSHGLAHQRARYFQAAVHAGFRCGRYVIADETIADARASLEAAEQAHDLRGLAFARFCLGFTLLLAGRDGEAEPLLATGLEDSLVLGDQQLMARYLAYTSLLYRRCIRVDEARATATRAAEIAQTAKLLDYVGVAHANLCWAAWRTGGHDLELHAELAIDAWARLEPRYVYPLQWLARAPLACHFLQLGQLDSARVQLKALADRKQHRLPDSLMAIIEATLDASVAVTCVDVATNFKLACERHRYL